MITLFWDIDGTLLSTAKAGVPAWETAILELTGKSFELASIRVPGLTDFQIAVRVLELLGVAGDGDTVEQLVRRYETLLPTTLPTRKGTVLPQVRAILDELGALTDVRSYLLTGNTQAGARAKLTHYDLMRYFDAGAFAEDAGERSTIAARALALARSAGPLDEGGLFVIGDTPHDIHCAHAIGARTIAVATGGYSEDELVAEQPWRVFPVLPAPADFLRLVREADRPAAVTGPLHSAR